jgi:hypothetical protein
MKMRTLVLGLLLSGCVMDAGDASDASDASDPSEELATTSQDSTVLDNCAVGTAANATGTITLFSGDSYTRGDLTMDLAGPTRCDCIDWQGLYDVDGETVADAAYPKCRPDAIFQVTVSKPPGFTGHFQAFSELTDKVHDAVDCSHSSIHMELWQELGRGLWKRLWSGSQIAHYDPPLDPTKTGRCYQTIGEASPTVLNGVYRVKAVATPAGEQGYGTITISGG